MGDQTAGDTTREAVALVMTALPFERSAVIEHLADVAPDPSHPTYETGRLGPGANWKVVVATTGRGNIAAALEAEAAIQRLRPLIAMFVGVAGARKDLAIGDVVVGEKVYGYESGKESPEGFQVRPDAIPGSHVLLQVAMALAADGAWRSRLPGGAAPAVVVKPIASGEKVVASSTSETAALLGQGYGDAVAVEMEGYGFSSAAFKNLVPAVVVRGISDRLDDKAKPSDDADQRRAASHAAAFALRMLERLPPGDLRAPTVISAIPTKAHDLPVRVILRTQEPPATTVASAIEQYLRAELRSQVQRADTEIVVDVEKVDETQVSLVVALGKTRWALTLTERNAQAAAEFVKAAWLVASKAVLEASRALISLSMDTNLPVKTRNIALDQAVRLLPLKEARFNREIENAFLALSQTEPWLTSSVTLHLFMHETEVKVRGTKRASALVSRSSAGVALHALRTGGGDSEPLYSLSQQVDEPRIAMQILHQLGDFDPRYTTRWYWHRDLGDKHYELAEFALAAEHYDHAARLLPQWSKLYRWAGDAYYYSGRWMAAVEQYRKALSLEPLEEYFVGPRLRFAERKLQAGRNSERGLRRWRSLAGRLEQWGLEMEATGHFRLAYFLCRRATRLYAFTSRAWDALAFQAARQGRYREAHDLLQHSLAGNPERPGTWLNATVDLLFEAKEWTPEAYYFAKGAVIHGGESSRARLELQLINTQNAEALLREFEESVLKPMLKAAKEWRRRQHKMVQSPKGDPIVHFEVLPGL